MTSKTADRAQLASAVYAAWQENGENITRAAEDMGVSRATATRRLKEHQSLLAEQEAGAAAAVVEPAPVLPVPTPGFCGCGCGEAVHRFFRQGHETRLASAIRSAYADGRVTRDEAMAYAAAVSDRFAGKVGRYLNSADAQAGAASAKLQWLVEDYTAGAGEQGLPARCIVWAASLADAVTAASARLGNPGSELADMVDLLAETVDGYLWEAAAEDDSAVFVQVRCLSAT